MKCNIVANVLWMSVGCYTVYIYLSQLYIHSLSVSLILSVSLLSPLCKQILERETRRERVLEARHKEQRLRDRVKGGPRGGGGGSVGGGGGGLAPPGGSTGGIGGGLGMEDEDDPRNIIKAAEEDYFKQVAEVSIIVLVVVVW